MGEVAETIKRRCEPIESLEKVSSKEKDEGKFTEEISGTTSKAPATDSKPSLMTQCMRGMEP